MATLLLVDDHPDLSDVVGELLLMNGHKVQKCVSGEEAVEKLQSVQPDAIVTDQRLPGMSGVDLCRRVRSDPALADIPVIVCSADDSCSHEVERAGADEFWLKGSERLFDGIARLDTLLQQFKAMRGISSDGQ